LEVVAMDGFTGFKTATTEEHPDAVAVMDPFHVVRLAGDALDQCRRRVQQNLHGHRGRAGDPLFSSRRMLHTGTDLLTDKQHLRLQALFGTDEHVEVEATWAIYQAMIAAYREPDRTRGRHLMTRLIASISHGVPAALSEVVTLGRTLTKRAGDILAYFDRPGTSNGPTEAICESRAPPRHRPRVPQPDQLCRQITPRDRRIQTPTTPSIVMSRICSTLRRGVRPTQRVRVETVWGRSAFLT
jgi:transposase